MNGRERSSLRAEEIAFNFNAHLPISYQKEIFEERLNFEREVLSPRKLERRRILIFGGAGYIGSVLSAHLLSRGYKVRVSDGLYFNNGITVLPYLDNPDFEFLYGDITDESHIDEALNDSTDVVILAGLVGDPITKMYPSESSQINDGVVLKLLERCSNRGLSRVIFVSTCSNYGLTPGNIRADEDYELNPLSLYAKSKVAAERHLMSSKGFADYSATILRFATAFGLSSRMRFDLTVSEFTRAMYRGDDLLVYDADTWRPYCHVKDFAEVIRRVLEAPLERVSFQVFNAGGDENNATKQTIVDIIKSLVPEAPVRYQEHGTDPRNYRVDFDRIREAIYFEPSITIQDGVVELLDALRQGLFKTIDQPPISVLHHLNYE